MAKSFLVIGLGRFGSAIAATLSKLGHEVMAVDCNMDYVNAISEHVLHAAQCDTTDERAIAALGVSEFDAVVISIGTDIRASVLTTVLCLEHGAKLVVAKAQDELHEKLLKKVGAHRVLSPEHDAGVRLARSLVMDNVLDYLSLSEDVSITEMIVPLKWVGQTLMELNVRRIYGVSVIAVRRGEKLLSNLDANFRLKPDDLLVFLGENKALDAVAKVR